MNFRDVLMAIMEDIFHGGPGRGPAPMMHFMELGPPEVVDLETVLAPKRPAKPNPQPSTLSVNLNQALDRAQRTPMPAAKTIAEPDTVHVVEIKRHGTQITLPKEMTLDDAIDTLERRRDYEDEATQFFEDIDVFPLDGAHALLRVVEAEYGWAQNFSRGWTPPAMVACRTGPKPTDKVDVPWAEFALPSPLEGSIRPGFTQKDGRFIFRLEATVKRRDEREVRKLFDKVRDFLDSKSIYQGKAIAVRFLNSEGKPLPMPEPEFIDTNVDENSLTFPVDTMAAVNTNLFVPIQRLEDLKANGIPIKRGVLLGGTYGTGKTMTAKVASKFAVQAGITFIYVRRAEELAMSIQFAKSYSKPAVVVFCEDVDQVTSGKRSVDMNHILNTLDGVDTKSMDLITILTTNHVEQITQAMLRPGRLDAVITIPPPDPQAVEKLLRIYGNGSIPKNANLAEVAQELDGAIPAIIAEVVKRAKLSQLALQKPGTKISEVSAAALLEAARTIKAQRELLAKNPAPLAPLPVSQH